MGKVYLWWINHPNFEYQGVALVYADTREEAKEIVKKEVEEEYGSHPWFDRTFAEEDPDDVMTLEKDEPFVFVAN